MDLHALQLDRRVKRAWVRAADASGEQRAELHGEAYDRLAQSAQPLFDWAHGRLPASSRTPRDSTLVAFDVDALQRSLRLAYVAERSKELAASGPAPSAMSPALEWCTASYEEMQTLLREAARTAVRELRPRLPDPPGLDAESRWEYCYQHGGDGWELGRAPPPLVRVFQTLQLDAEQRALVLGCGRGHEAMALAGIAQPRGAQVVAMDIAPTAVRLTREAATAAGLSCLRAYEVDLFDPSGAEPLSSGAYDLIVEHTCYCAIETRRRDEYVAVLRRLLKSGGRFVGLFYCHDYPGGPPYGASIAEIRARLGADFVIEHEEVPRDSVLTRAGLEWLVAARQKP